LRVSHQLSLAAASATHYVCGETCKLLVFFAHNVVHADQVGKAIVQMLLKIWTAGDHKHNMLLHHYQVHTAWEQAYPACTYQVVICMSTVVPMVADRHMPFAQTGLFLLVVTATTKHVQF